MKESELDKMLLLNTVTDYLNISSQRDEIMVSIIKRITKIYPYVLTECVSDEELSELTTQIDNSLRQLDVLKVTMEGMKT